MRTASLKYGTKGCWKGLTDPGGGGGGGCVGGGGEGTEGQMPVAL